MKSLLTLMLLMGAVAPAFAGDQLPPNVVFILADDLGWSDTTLNGTTKLYETPHIQRLAAQGMTFHQAYAAAPICSPTRGSILAGLYPGRLGITTPSCHEKDVRLEATLPPRAAPSQKCVQPTSVTRLKQEYVTLAEVLKQAGYATGHFGKWHLGLEPYDPLHQGFDVDVPHWPGPGPAGYVAPWKPASFPLKAKPGEHVEDLMCEEALKFLREHREKPFFLNYWAFSVHSPWGAKEAYTEEAKKRIQAGDEQHNPLYAAMVRSLDDAVGRLLDALDELKLTERTIIVFFSDNGGVNWWEPKMKEQNGMDSAPTSNAPLRGGKGTLYEGGTREPCVISWPGKVKPGSHSEALFNSVDFYPTLLEMTGVPRPTEVKLDGVSQVPALLGQEPPRKVTFCYFPHSMPPGHVVEQAPGAWVRQGDWKLIRLFHDGEDQKDRFELYDLSKDPGEKTNLAASSGEKVAELNALLSAHLKEISALVPIANPAYNPQVPDMAPSKDATVTLKGQNLVIQSSGTNPSLAVRDLPASQGPYTVGVRMRSTSKGAARIYWAANPQQPLHRDRSAAFTPKHDGEWHNYLIPLPVETPVTVLRFDLASGPGEIEVEFLRLRDHEKKLIKQWPTLGNAAGQ